jgi:hypothetical protein
MFRAFGAQQDFVQTFCRARITEETAFSTLSISSVSSDTAASFNKNAEPVNTDSSHRFYQRAIIPMTGLVLASLCRQDGETTGQVKEGSAT